MKKIILPLILTLAFILRFWHFSDYFVFSLEEMNILYTLEKFLAGNWSPLLGQEATGYVHHLFHSPWYLYLFSIVYKISNGEPLIFGYIHIFLGTASVLVWYLIGQRLKNLKLGLTAAFLSAASFQLISIDRSAWAVGLIPFSTTVVIYLYISAIKTKKIVWLISLGLWLGFMLSLHYQSLVVIFLVFTSSIFLFQKKTLYMLPAFLLTFTPLIIFDFRHNFFNLIGFFLAAKTILAGNSPYSSSHFLFFIYPLVIFLSAALLSKTPKVPTIIALTIYLIIQMNDFTKYPVLKSYSSKNTLANEILNHYDGKKLTIFFKDKDSFENRYILFLRAKNRGIDTSRVLVLEPWQNSSSAQLIIESGKIHKP